jgi:predicted DNA-binding antitoxin AbrB/MazE fold protein
MIITAIYEGGVLRPLTPLALYEKQTVQLELLPAVAPESVVARLVNAGILTPPQGTKEPPPLSLAERQTVADKLATMVNQPLSVMILAEREG